MSSKNKTPKPPDPYQTAAAQTQVNQQTATANADLNRVNQVTPYGNVTYTSQPGPNGVPRYTQTVTESDPQRQLRELEEQQGIQLGQMGLEQTGRIGNILNTPFTPDRFQSEEATGGMLDINAQLGNFGDDVRQRSFDLATQGMGQMFDRSEESLRTRLANQGINAGTEAFGAEMADFNRGKGNAYADALLAADNNAMAQRGQALSEVLGQRQTNLAEQEADYQRDYAADLAGRQVPLQEITSIMSGLPINPLNPGAVSTEQMAPVDLAGLLGQNYAGQLNAYGTRVGAQNATVGALGNILGGWLGSRGQQGA